ncbi:MAG TPA: DUF58 domain-containing protein [Phycisphaerae bacterium]|nr:DUF58 domain-containing protein [Phycisphaerae bacterium]
MANPTGSAKYLRPDVLARISGLELRARHVVEGFVSGMHRSPYHGYSVEFSQYKEYSPGDDLRHLDWRVFGRSDRFFVKQYEEETNLRAHLVLDCSGSMRYPDQEKEAGRLTKFEYAATLAASLAYLLVYQQDAVGLLLFDNAVRANLPALSNQAHLHSIIGQIERARLENPSDAGMLFDVLASKLTRRSLVVVISDLLTDEAALTKVLERLRYARHEVLVFHVLDHDEREFPFLENTQFEGLETPDTQLLVDPQALRTGYLDALNQFIGRLRTACTNARIEYVGLSTTEPLDVALRAFLAARMRVMKGAA